MIRADFECFFSALRDRIADVWDIPEDSPILEAGDEPTEVDPSKFAFPWAIIELGEEVSGNIGPAAMDITWDFPLYLWLVTEKVADEHAIATMREKLSDMVTVCFRDPHLKRQVNNLIPVSISWNPSSRPWPVMPTQGTAMMGGYVGLRFQLIESRVM
jgi:hypothetical protein